MIYRILNINDVDYEEIKKKVSHRRIERSEKYKYDIDKKRSVAVEYLLNEMLVENGYEIQTPVDITYDEHGKPHLLGEDGADTIYFSLSHSGDYVACMISDRPCGIDIEKHKDREYEKIARRICTDLELYGIETSQKFFDLWTAKESILKAYGLGLALDMRSFEIKREGSLFTTRIDEKEYQGAIENIASGYSLSYVEQIV